MRIRHLVAMDNVDEVTGMVIDPHQIRHGIIVAGRVGDLGGAIDPATHLNLDFPAHRADRCTVVARCERGAPAAVESDGFRYAQVDPRHYRHLGRHDLGEALVAWHQQFGRAERERRAVETL